MTAARPARKLGDRDSERTVSAADVLARLRALANPANVEGMARFGISEMNTLGVSIPTLRELAKECGRDHALAGDLWESGLHEARILASMVDDPGAVNDEQLERWVAGFDSWDVCDQVCMNLFAKTSFAYDKVLQWCRRDEEFVKRAGFALIACLAWGDKKASDESLLRFLPLVVAAAMDERNFVKKAVNWALRQIGKRNAALNVAAVAAAREIAALDSKAARWVASDALRELTAEKTLARLAAKPR